MYIYVYTYNYKKYIFGPMPTFIHIHKYTWRDMCFLHNVYASRHIGCMYMHIYIDTRTLSPSLSVYLYIFIYIYISVFLHMDVYVYGDRRR